MKNIPKSTSRFDVIRIDHYGPVDNGRQHILVVIEAGTIFVRLYPTKTTNTKQVICHLRDNIRILEEHSVRHIKLATG